MAAKRLPHSLLCLLVCIGPGTFAADAPRALRTYEVTTETGMPHLEENLRYATRRETRCLDPADLSTAFWMLKHESLQDCRLDKSPDAGTPAPPSARYELVCTGGHGTSGSALWELEPNALRGTLNVRLGGKNMTFYQRIVAKPIGACTGPLNH